MSYSLNLWGESDRPEAVEILVASFVAGLPGVQGGTLNAVGRPQVTFGPTRDYTAPANTVSLSSASQQEEAGAMTDPTTPGEEPDAASEPEDAPEETPEGTEEAPEGDVHPQAGALASASVEELEAELNRRSAEGQSYANDGSPLQSATSAEIEAAIAVLGGPSADAEETGEADAKTSEE